MQKVQATSVRTRTVNSNRSKINQVENIVRIIILQFNLYKLYSFCKAELSFFEKEISVITLEIGPFSSRSGAFNCIT